MSAVSVLSTGIGASLKTDSLAALRGREGEKNRSRRGINRDKERARIDDANERESNCLP